MAIPVLVLLLAAVAILWLQVPAKPQPIRARRNLLQEEMLAAYMDRRDH